MPFFPGLEKARLVTDVFARNKERFGPFAAVIGDVMRPTPTLGKVAREAIALHVSALNGCHYCVGSHGTMLSELGCKADEISGMALGSHADPKLAAILSFAGKLTTDPKGIAPEDVGTLRGAEASDQDIEDTIAIAAVFAFMNRLVDGYGLNGDEAAFALVAQSIAKNGYDSLTAFLGAAEPR